VTTTALVVVAVATTSAVVTLAAAAVMVTVEARTTATAVTLLVASGSGNIGNGTTMDVCDAILLRYTNVVNVESNDDGNRAPAIDGGNIDGGVANFDNGMRRTCGGQQHGGERVATPAVAVAAAVGRGSTARRTEACHRPWHYGGKHSLLNVLIC
jgi:hypothetical protein